MYEVNLNEILKKQALNIFILSKSQLDFLIIHNYEQFS